MYAIVKTGGKQYRVNPGAEIFVEKLAGSVGDQVTLPALCVVDGDKVMAKASEAQSVAVVATIMDQTRGPKAMVFKLKKRKNYKKKQGHRQALTRLHIDSIGDVKAEKAAASKAAAKAESDANDEADAAESRAGLLEAAEAQALEALDKEPETAQEKSERDQVKDDVEMADIEYEAASDIPDAE